MKLLDDIYDTPPSTEQPVGSFWVITLAMLLGMLFGAYCSKAYQDQRPTQELRLQWSAELPWIKLTPINEDRDNEDQKS